ncbi:MAG: hypothetical protein K0Q95_701 [Bacteroidota bacterium]|jgi:hypothetical protein|nr:hypothetical protein [Bacteroidota bacterium]
MSKRYTLLLAFVSALFFALFSLLCYYSRLATDDYFFISDVRSHGIITGVTSQYIEWCGRYAATFLMDVIYSLLDVNQTWYFLYPSASFVLLLTGIYKLIQALSYHFEFNLSKPNQRITAVYFIILLFFSSVDIGETWIWYCSLSSYLWSVIAFVWACTFIFGNSSKLISILFSSLCLIYAGGSSEVYSVIYGVLFLLVIIYRYKASQDFQSFKNDLLVQRLTIPYIVFGIAFVIFLIAPGNYLRDQLFPERHVGQAFLFTIKSVIKFGVLFIPFRLAYVIAFGVPFIVIGSSMGGRNATITFNAFFKLATIIFLSLVLLVFVLIAYVMMETGPPRLWFIISFLFSVYVTAVCFYAGYSGYISEPVISVLKRSALMLAVLILGYNLWHQSVICPKYAKAHDERIRYVTELNKTLPADTTITLTPLPSSGMLYSSEIKADTNHFTNRELRLGYDLKFQVLSE